ncbi:hypothetical protein F4821DRAFT_226867 [Hypoxylon rubiginosum]|uniref:Uncharacterized protein n=1 Tax=Hypoxylon rubiginosum TaxID=110542 RepID=A0ACC0DEN2_9PEZI|nr:hypothetical protein F4821DRAFT_226867 [Hypoxylon rubiginosum]
MADQPTNNPISHGIAGDSGSDTAVSVPGRSAAPTPTHQAAHQHPAYTPSIKPEDIGLFYPPSEYEKKSSVVYFNVGINMLIFTEVNCFILQIYNQLGDPAAAPSNARQIMSFFPSLLLGDAAQWWSYELTREDRDWFREAGLEHLLPALGRRFSGYTIQRAPLWAPASTHGLEC